MILNRRLIAAVFCAGALLAGATACKSSASGAASSSAGDAVSASASPSASASSLSADDMAAAAVANLKKASSVHMEGTVIDGKDRMALNLTMTRGKGCKGSIGMGSQGSFQMTVIGKTLYIEPDAAFWKSAGAGSVLGTLKGKYIKTTISSKDFGDFATLCDPDKFASAIDGTTGLVRGATTTIGGQPAVELKDSGDNSSGWVSTGSKPELLKMTSPTDGSLTFSGFDKPVTITAPPASKVLDGKKYGF